MPLIHSEHLDAATTDDLRNAVATLRARLRTAQEATLLDAAITFVKTHNIPDANHVAITTLDHSNGIHYGFATIKDSTCNNIDVPDEITDALDSKIHEVLTDLTELHYPLARYTTMRIDLLNHTVHPPGDSNT